MGDRVLAMQAASILAASTCSAYTSDSGLGRQNTSNASDGQRMHTNEQAMPATSQ